MRKSRSVMLMLVPSATVFFSSGCIMIIELVASRLIARDLGSSLYTWTSIIGVVLAGIALGNYAGGRIADRFPAGKSLAVQFSLCSASCATIVILNNLVGKWIGLWELNWPLHVFVHVSLVFLIPSTLLGTISPVVAKMALDQGLAAGRTVGSIYAWGAAGSIAGTFLAGFYLIATFGSVAIVWAIGAAMLLMAMLYWARFWILYAWALVFILLLTLAMWPGKEAQAAGAAIALRAPSDANVLYEKETQYCYVAVRRVSENPDRRAFMQDKLKHSEIVIGDVTKLQYFYTEIYAGLTHVLSKGKTDLSMMIIGGGGYAFPQYLKHFWPDANVEVVEIDPGVTKAAMEAFGLDRNTTIKTISMDARNYVDQLLKRESDKEIPQYDFIYEDAINDDCVPFQLVTQEFNEGVRRILKDDGVYMINLIDTYTSAQFLGAVVNTVRRTFPHVYVITDPVTYAVTLRGLRQTFVVVGTKRPIDPCEIFAQYNKSLRLWFFGEDEFQHIADRSRGVVLTDDYAPVENLLAPVGRQNAREELARKIRAQAQRLQRDPGKWQVSVAKYRRAVELNPSMSLMAYNAIGGMYVQQGDPKDAAAAYADAIEYYKRANTGETAVANVYYNYGTVLRQLGQEQQAIAQFAEAVRWFKQGITETPRDPLLWYYLGETYAAVGNFKDASEAFSMASALEADNILYLQKLSKALELQGRYSEAGHALRRAVDVMKKQNMNTEGAELAKYADYLEYRAKQPAK